jgi:uncharacterized protein YqeY
MTNHESKSLRENLKSGLVQAMKARQTQAISTLRSILSEIDNAEAVPMDASIKPTVGFSNDVPRKILSEEQMQNILEHQYHEIQASLAEYKRLEKHDEAAQLQVELDVLTPYLKDSQE